MVAPIVDESIIVHGASADALRDVVGVSCARVSGGAWC